MSKKTDPYFLWMLRFICVFLWRKNTTSLILCHWGRTWMVNIFCQPFRSWNIDTFICCINRWNLRYYIFTLNFKLVKKSIFVTENKKFDILAPVSMSVKFDFSFSSSRTWNSGENVRLYPSHINPRLRESVFLTHHVICLNKYKMS